MALDAINKIKEAELKSSEIDRESKIEANNIILDAKKESSEMLDFARSKSEDSRKSKLLTAKTWADEYLKEKEKKLVQEVDKLKSSADRHFGEAVDLVLNKIINVKGKF